MGDAKYPEAERAMVARYVEDIASRRDGAKVDQWLCVCKKTLTGSFGRKFGHLIGKKGCGLAPCTALSNEERSELKGLAGSRKAASKAAPGGAASSLAADANLVVQLWWLRNVSKSRNAIRNVSVSQRFGTFPVPVQHWCLCNDAPSPCGKYADTAKLGRAPLHFACNLAGRQPASAVPV